MYKKIKKIHLIGIGGIGMSGIAELLLSRGFEVTGSDLSRSYTVQRLEKLGIAVQQGHHPDHISGAELVVYSSAVKAENPELAEARQKQIPTIFRAEMLAELMRTQYGIAVAGAHGKTTTTSMMAMVLTEADLDPTVVVGGRMDNFGGTNARLGQGEFMVVEADESDGSFNRLSPSIAIVTNIDREHMEYYRTMRDLQAAFLKFLNAVPFYGLSVLCGDDPYLRILHHKITRRKVTYGFEPHNRYHITSYHLTESGSEANVKIDGDQEWVRLQVPGKHNMLNAIATLAVADELSLPRKRALKALYAYQGVERRFHFRGEIKGVKFIDDYAHHPTEIQATLEAAKEKFPHANLWVVFQPHRYSRVEDLFHELSTSFRHCKSVGITPIYAAGEKPIAGIDSAVLVDNIKRFGVSARLFASPKVAIENWQQKAHPGDVILTLGAGDLPNVYSQLF